MSTAWLKFYGAVAFVLTLFLIGGAAFRDEDGFFGANTAAWVQALGSIGAIFAGFVWAADAAHRQSERDDQNRSVALAAARANARHIAATAVERLGRMVRYVERNRPGEDSTFSLGDVRSMQATAEAQRLILIAFPAHTLESQTLTSAFLSFAALMTSVHGNCDIYRGYVETDGREASYEPFLNALRGCYETARHRLLQFDEIMAGRPKPHSVVYDKDDIEELPVENGGHWRG